jgi:HK97 gp10 family phage protein
MSGPLSFELIGAKELDRKLMGLDAKVARKVAGKALRAGAKIALAEARSEVPVRTGALKKSIRITAGKNSKGFRSVRVGMSDKWYTGDEFYAAFVEFGHQLGKRTTGGARKLRKQAAYLRDVRKRTGDKALLAKERELRAESVRLNRERKNNRRMIEGKHFLEKSFARAASRALDVVLSTLKTEIEAAART